MELGDGWRNSPPKVSQSSDLSGETLRRSRVTSGVSRAGLEWF